MLTRSLAAPVVELDPFDEAFLADPHAHHQAGNPLRRLNNALRAIESLPVEVEPR